MTASQVEDGSASLMDFTRAVRDQHKIQGPLFTPQEALYFSCLTRQDGSAYRAGSTYLVRLTPDGRVSLHASAMRFSGRLLNPAVYGEILNALGVSPTDLANLASSDPATSSRGLAAVLGTLAQEPDAPFDATATIPGASGHAAVYLSANFGVPIVLLGGFDLNESHLITEVIDFDPPSVTAKDVMDRETLKEFVTEAGNFVLRLQQRDPAAGSKVKVALRDPHGPWRHGSVYL